LLPAINIVTKEKIVGCGRKATHFKESNEVGILTVNISNNLYGWRQFDQRGLAKEDVTSGETYRRNLSVFETQRFTDFACVTHIQKALDHVIDIY
jgi:hypothetical protein